MYILEIAKKKTFMGLVLFVFAMILPSQGFAQGFAPTKDSVWLKAGYIYGQAQENFAGYDERRWAPATEPGKIVDFRSRSGQVVGGFLFSHDLMLDAVWSPIEALSLGASFAAFRYVHYSNEVNMYQTTATGTGDIRLSASYQVTPRDQGQFGSSIYARVKVPTKRSYPYNNTAIISEGQVDISLGWANSYKLMDRVYLNGGLEFRKRLPYYEPTRFAILGDELDAFLSVGTGIVPNLWLSAGVSGMWGAPWIVQQAQETSPTTRQRREFHSLLASAYFSFGDMIGVPGLALDVWYKHPIGGQDHAVFMSGGLGIAYGFSVAK